MKQGKKDSIIAKRKKMSNNVKRVLNVIGNVNERNEKLKRKKTVRDNLQVAVTEKRNVSYRKPWRSVIGILNVKTRVNVSSETVNKDVKNQ